jgi:glycosyltransferase involved in cell wall biosynthesis
MPIHVCHISLSAGGVETYIINLLRHTDRAKFRHSVICYTDGTLAVAARNAGAHVIMVPMVREIAPLRDLLSCVRVLLVVSRLKPDIIHAHSGKGGILGRLVGVILGIPVAFTPNAFSYLGQRGARRALVVSVERLFALLPCFLVASSPSEAKRAIEEVGWKPERVTATFSNSVEVQRGQVEHSPKDNLGVLTVGRLCYQKNPEMLLRAARIVKARSDSITFTVIGAGYSDELGRKIAGLIEDFNLADVVHVKPWVDSALVEQEMLESDIYVTTSRYESFGFATAEAMVKGLPVVATNIDGSVDLVEDGKSGYLVDVDDDEAMALCICRLAADSDLRMGMGAMGRERIKTLFNIRTNAPRLEAIYSSLHQGLQLQGGGLATENCDLSQIIPR